MGKRVTTKEFKERIYKINPNIVILNEYTGSATHNRIYCKCKVCGHEWDTAPASLSNGSGCPNCANISRRKKGRFKGHEKFVNDLQKIQPNIKILSKYEGTHKLIKCQCTKHLSIWSSYPCNLLNNTAHCPECTKEKNKKRVADRHDDFVKKLYNFRNDIEVIGNYEGYHKKILCRCRSHDELFYSTPANLFHGHTSCPAYVVEDEKCSKGERYILKYIRSKNYHYSYQHTFDNCRFIMPLRFDFYLPDFNTCIEYDGEQHYHPVSFKSESESIALKNHQDCVRRDKIKDQYCKNNNIKLIRIPYWDLDKIEEILEAKIKNPDPQRLSHPA